MEYFYNSSDNLSSCVDKNYLNSNAYKEVYVYNIDGTVTRNTFSGNLVSQTSSLGYYSKFYFQNSEMLKQEGYDNNNTLVATTNYIYDGKNNPTRNILGFDKIFFAFDGCGNFQNVMFVNLDPTEYTYDSNNFPITTVIDQFKIEYFY